MHECHCGGNNSLRSAIGAVRCECGGKLNQAQIFYRLIDRINEIEEDQFRMIGALQRLGADRCDHCGEWHTGTWVKFDHCSCLECLAANPEWPLDDEDLEENEFKEMSDSIVRFLANNGRTPHKYSGDLLEAYKRMSAAA